MASLGPIWPLTPGVALSRRGIGSIITGAVLLILAGCGAVYYYHGGSRLASRHLSEAQQRHQEYLAGHQDVARAEADFEREIKRRQEGLEGILTPQQRLQLIEHEEQQGLAQHAAHDPHAHEAWHQAQQQAAQQHGDEALSPTRSIYDFPVTSIHGESFTMERYRGKVLLIVNVASACGYTQSNYDGLQQLYERYAAYGLEVRAVPGGAEVLGGVEYLGVCLCVCLCVCVCL